MRVEEMKTKTPETIGLKLRRVLKSIHPSHDNRLWLAGYLLWAHNDNVVKVCHIIHRTNEWEDYSLRITRQQVESVLRSKKSGVRGDHLCVLSSFLQGKELTPREVDNLEAEFDWDKAQRKAFAETERRRQCLNKSCYLEPDCIQRPCGR